MRLLVVSNLYPPNVVGGYERLCYDAVCGLVERRHQVTVLTSSFGDKVAEYPGQTVRRELRLLIGERIYDPFTGSPEERDRINGANVATLLEALAEVRPDAIFAWNLFFFDRSMRDALASSGVPLVLLLTDNWLLTIERPDFWMNFFRESVLGNTPFPTPAAPLAAAGPSSASIGRRAWRWLRRNFTAAPPPPLPAPGEPAIRFPFGAIFGSNFVRDLYAAGGIGFAREDIVHNGVQQQGYAGKSCRERNTLIDPRELRLLFVGRMVDLKGVHTTVEALALLDPVSLGVERVRLTIVGDMQDVAYVVRLREQIASSGCAKRIALQPPVPEEALFELFQAHDIYLFPSLYEPFSLTLIHAMASGIPTIASRAGGNVEIVRERETGLLFEKGAADDLARAVQVLVREPRLRASVAAAGRHLARDFTVERMVDRMETILLRTA